MRLFTLFFVVTSVVAAQAQSETKSTSLNATIFPGSDIGAKVNAAFASCNGRCKVEIPAGNYTYSTTINLPVQFSGGATLQCDSESTTLNYIGSGDAISASGTGDTESGLIVKDCGLSGSSSTGNANGLHLRALGEAVFENIRIKNFPGAGVLNEGANSVTFLGPDFEVNSINIHNVGVVLDGVGYSTNSTKVFGGIIGYAKQWGVFEDFSQARLAFPNGGNVYDGVVFEANGTDGQTSGNIFFQGCDGCVVSNSYLEFFPKNHIPYNIVVGDSSSNGIGGLDYAPQGVKIINNHLLSDNATTSIYLINARMPIVDGNSEVGNVVNFVNQSAAVQFCFIGRNIALDATNYVAGTGITGVGIGNNIDATEPTSNGLGFNSVTGLEQDLQIRTRQGGANNLVGVNSAGAEVYAIDNNGVADFNGVRVETSGLTFNTPLAKINTVGGNNLVTGTIVLSNATSGTVTFVTPYTTPPSCQITPLGEIKSVTTGTAVARERDTSSLKGLARQGVETVPPIGSAHWWVSTTPSGVTANLSAPGSVSFSYFCVGDAN